MANQCSDSESKVRREILSYLVENPEAQDTLEGIVEWWLLDREIKRRQAMVRKALEVLIAESYVTARKDWAGRHMYRINPSKVEEIKAFLGQGPDPE